VVTSGSTFSVTERTNITARNPDTGTFDRLRTLPYFGGGAANLYVGAPVYSDAVYVRLAFEFLSIPRSAAGAADVSPSFNPVILMESAAVEVNPFTWATRAGRWLREGFKLTGGVFVVPFGIEDEEHDAPVRWWVTRPLAMSAGRVYPGTWIDIGAMIKWKPTFGSAKPIRPIEIDLGVVNGDACTQTRSNDLLYRYQPVGQVDETCERRLRDVEKINRGDGSVLGIAPDNNGNKSFVGRVMIRPVPAVNVGGSVVWGKHPESSFIVSSFLGQTFVDTRQAATWRAGGHLDLNFDEMITSPYPLPHLRGEVVYGVDAAAPPLDADSPILADRRMLGAYAQIAQPLWRRKRLASRGSSSSTASTTRTPISPYPGGRPPASRSSRTSPTPSSMTRRCKPMSSACASRCSLASRSKPSTTSSARTAAEPTGCSMTRSASRRSPTSRRTKPKILDGGILTLEVGIGVNAAGKINRIKVYDYRGNLELTKDNFLTQLRDKTLESDFTMGKGGLVAVIGEPEESQLVSNAAREALLLMKVALGRRE
jgi:hypothetical protein